MPVMRYLVISTPSSWMLIATHTLGIPTADDDTPIELAMGYVEAPCLSALSFRMGSETLGSF